MAGEAPVTNVGVLSAFVIPYEFEDFGLLIFSIYVVGFVELLGV
jgi:hypothetical protein